MKLPVQNMKQTRALDRTGPLAVAKFFVNLFSTNQRRRESPDAGASKTQHARLITIKASHYCEKGRWGLDLVEADATSPLYYTEDAHPPAFSSFATVPASNDTGSVTPMVLRDGEPIIASSDMLLRKFCPFLYPKEIEQEVKELEDDLGARLGPTIRVFCYHHLLQPEYYYTLCAMSCLGTSKVETFLFEKMLSKGIDKGMRKIMGIDEEASVISQKEIGDIFAEMSNRLDQNGGQYLTDTKEKSYGFTAADLTLAALAGPLIRPPEMIQFQSAEDQLPPVLVTFANELRETKAGQHVLRMYAEHRLPSGYGSDVVTLKSVDRNCTPWSWWFS